MGRKIVEPVLTFDPETHEYRLNGEVVPSVTQVLSLAGLIDGRWYTPDAAQRGTYVAQATEMDDEGTLDESALDPALRAYVEAWRKFRTDTRCDVIAAEHIVWSAVHRFAGTLDRWLLIDGKDTLIDIKTGSPEPFHPIQTAGYAACLKVHMERGAVYLSDNANYRLVAHDDPLDRGVFLSALTIAQWKIKHGRNLNEH